MAASVRTSCAFRLISSRNSHSLFISRENNVTNHTNVIYRSFTCSCQRRYTANSKAIPTSDTIPSRQHWSLNTMPRSSILFTSHHHSSVLHRHNHTHHHSRGSNATEPDPFSLVESDLTSLYEDIKKEIPSNNKYLRDMAHYHFDGQGKAFRPMVVTLMARACNNHQGCSGLLLQSQRRVGMISEMIHTASLVHDDVIDEAETRRGKASIQAGWGQRQAILTGDFILSAASVCLARIRNNQVVSILSQVLEDLVSGEFMQLGSKEDETERFNHYLNKTYKKTASLMANSCKAVAVLSGCSDSDVEHAFKYGRNVGIAFQLVDDLLDFISSEQLMGKPTAADLKLGLATAPVLFAAHQFPDLNPLIMRRFSEPGDVEVARQLVAQSEGISHTRYLAGQHCQEAVRQISGFTPSTEKQALVTLTHKVLSRLK